MNNKPCYISTNDNRAYVTTNIREKPSEDSKIISQLTKYGSTVKFVDEIIDKEHIWSSYILPAGVVGWIRNDVHNRVNLKEKVEIPIEYVSQEDADSDMHINDCGIACSLMLIKFKLPEFSKSVEVLANEVGMSRRELTSPAHILETFRRSKVEVEHRRPFDLAAGLTHLNSGRPYIALINYKYINKKKDFPHFIVVNGYDNDYIYVLDPIDAKNTRISFLNFANAIYLTSEQGNYPFNAFVLL